MCRVCYGPNLSCAEFAMCRVVPPKVEVTHRPRLTQAVQCSF